MKHLSRMSTRFGAILTILLMLFVLVVPVFAQSGEPATSPPLAMPALPPWLVSAFASVFTPLLAKQLLTLLGLIVLQVGLAVALAIRESNFEWNKLADFYRVMVAPFVLGWLIFIIVAKLISLDMLGPTYGVLVGDGVTWLAWLAVVTSLGARIFSTVKALYGTMAPFPVPDQQPK